MTDLHARLGNVRGTVWHLRPRTRRLLLLAPPLTLAGFTVLHPQPDHSARGLMDASTWFMGFHMIQLVLIGLVAISVFLLADELHRASAWPTCIGMGTFLVFFGAYDTLAGIGTGLVMRSARRLPGPEQETVFGLVSSWPTWEPWVVWLSLLGTFGWVLALGSLAVSARAAGAPRSQWAALGLAAFFLMLGHPAPFGTFAFGSLFVAALLRERQQSRAHDAPAPPRTGAGQPGYSASRRRSA